MEPGDTEQNPFQTGGRQNRSLMGRLKLAGTRLFSKKPALKPEVIELGIPAGDEPSTSSHVNANAGREPYVPPSEQSSRVFDNHIAVLYDRYVNFKEAVSIKLRDKIMKFMTTDLENAPTDGILDIEGGITPRQSGSTYDGAILLLTIVLGFVFRLPLMWIIGSVLFLVYGNFKRKIIKWGVVNIVLSVISIAYAFQIWNYNDPE